MDIYNILPTYKMAHPLRFLKFKIKGRKCHFHLIMSSKSEKKKKTSYSHWNWTASHMINIFFLQMMFSMIDQVDKKYGVQNLFSFKPTIPRKFIGITFWTNETDRVRTYHKLLLRITCLISNNNIGPRPNSHFSFSK